MKSKRKQLLISSMVMLLVAMLAVTSTTFAWFSQGDNGTISNFEFTAEEASGIQLSADAENWKGTIDADTILAAVKDYDGTDEAQDGSIFYDIATDKPATFNAMSSAGVVEDGVMKLYTAAVQPDGTYYTEVADKGFYAFNIYIKNTASQTKGLTLSTASVTNKDATSTHKAELATRVAFVAQGSVSKGSYNATTWKSNAITQALASGNASVVYEPNATTHTGNATTYYGATANTVASYVAVNYASTVATDTLDADTTTGFINAEDDKVIAVENLTTDITTVKPEIAELAPDSITKITIYVWLEGQDVDCNTMNDIASGDVVLNFGFKAVDKYSLTYDLNGKTLTAGSLPTDSTKYAKGTNATVKFDTTMAVGEVTFVGWSTNKDTLANATSDIIKSTDTTKTIAMNANTTLYAIWSDAVEATE